MVSLSSFRVKECWMSMGKGYQTKLPWLPTSLVMKTHTTIRACHSSTKAKQALKKLRSSRQPNQREGPYQRASTDLWRRSRKRKMLFSIRLSEHVLEAHSWLAPRCYSHSSGQRRTPTTSFLWKVRHLLLHDCYSIVLPSSLWRVYPRLHEGTLIRPAQGL